jgi:hypothetical protein
MQEATGKAQIRLATMMACALELVAKEKTERHALMIQRRTVAIPMEVYFRTSVLRVMI